MDHAKTKDTPAYVGPLLVTIDKYAEQSGLTRRSVETQINNGDLPSRKIGKRRMVNMLLLARQLAGVEQ
jgi:hypothetical protein